MTFDSARIMLTLLKKENLADLSSSGLSQATRSRRYASGEGLSRFLLSSCVGRSPTK